MKIEIKILNKEFYQSDDESDLPNYATLGSAAVDLRCTKDVTIYPGKTEMINTGIAVWLGTVPVDGSSLITKIAGLIIPRSGLGTKGLVLANTVGLIDADYQGELKVAALNRNPSIASYSEKHYLNAFTDIFNHFSSGRIELKAGDRIAQLLLVPVIAAEWELVEEFSNQTERGQGGYGSTGI